MKKRIPVIILILLIIFTGIYIKLISPILKEHNRISSMAIQNINLNTIDDGEYIGSFDYRDFVYEVSVEIKNHRITNAKVLKNRTTEHAKKAERVIPLIIEQQTLHVDVVTGASTTSKVLLKAVEEALRNTN